MRLDQQLQALAAQAFQSCFDAALPASDFSIQKTRKEFAGDRTLVCFPLARHSRMKPDATAEALGQALVAADGPVLAFNVVKGFLNLELDPTLWRDWLLQEAAQGNYGRRPAGSAPHVMVEYSSPNTNKPLHLGHLRNNFLGHSISRILEAHGHTVTKVQIINDRGIHICKSMVAWRKFGEGETPKSSGLKGDKLVGKYYVAFNQAYKAEVQGLIDGGMDKAAAEKQAPILLEAQETLRLWEDGDAATVDLWKTMNGWVYAGFDTTYATMGVEFDKLYYESDTYLIGKDRVMEGLERGAFEQREDGSVWVDLSEDGLDEKLLLRQDGTAVYMTQDIGTALLRFQDVPDLDRQVYTVGNEQEYHFKVLFLVLGKLGFEQAQRCHHLSYGMVELPEGKMKSREGTVVDADDLMDEMFGIARDIAAEAGKLDDVSEAEQQEVFQRVGLSALKYYLLKVDPKKNMMFDPKASIDFYGNTGPFILFNYVRGRSVLRKAEAEGLTLPTGGIATPGADEMDMVGLLHDLPDVVAEAAETYNPALIANWCYDLTKSYSSYYQDHSILGAEDEAVRNLRMALTERFTRTLNLGMSLLGIALPERM
ncbi:MAG: arginine--tRNA ligase [Crocinitomicaceae bacterium TMED114]|nr:MAG: arginine--tRNA ligase [Crocinitomicaceae bacterium TMED114]RPG81559.1 MAG: arginine--tRNA ligase [Crocinitomicaceae bacterium TMED114]